MRKPVLRSMVMTGAILAGATVAQGNALADGAKQTSKPGDVAIGTRLAARSDPAVVLIELKYTGTVVVPLPRRTKAFDALTVKARRHAKAGRIPSDRQSQIKWILRTAASDVGRYLKPGEKKVDFKNRSFGGYCTGWWITPNGYMVTGAHCVSTPKAVVRQGFGNIVLPGVNAEEVKGYLKSIAGVAQPDDEMVKLAGAVFGGFNTRNMRVIGVRSKIGVVRALPGGGMDATSKVTPLRRVAQGRTYPGEDFALLKMNGAGNLPTVPLGDDADVQVGDELYINGFPGVITNSPIFNPRSKLYPALTQGAFNARRTTIAGVPYIQAQAPSYGGNSGGPVLDERGRVVGTLIAGPGNDAMENQSYILPVGIIKKHLATAGVRPVQSRTSRIYNSALDDFFARRYRAALPKFRQVRELYPAHPYVTTYIRDTRKAIAAGQDKTPKNAA
ncbi:trypsin-like peptidase domain-containing protein [Nonomuraea sp. NPDC049480]|uniref:trypsin-like peptidase domain-containing protein n=1 Tax=Nonomuraea sp. NPDC049480 TaxID=3364353 RepID=UPI00378A176C